MLTGEILTVPEFENRLMTQRYKIVLRQWTTEWLNSCAVCQYSSVTTWTVSPKSIWNLVRYNKPSALDKFNSIDSKWLDGDRSICEYNWVLQVPTTARSEKQLKFPKIGYWMRLLLLRCIHKKWLEDIVFKQLLWLRQRGLKVYWTGWLSRYSFRIRAPNVNYELPAEEIILLIGKIERNA